MQQTPPAACRLVDLSRHPTWARGQGHAQSPEKDFASPQALPVLRKPQN